MSYNFKKFLKKKSEKIRHKMIKGMQKIRQPALSHMAPT